MRSMLLATLALSFGLAGCYPDPIINERPEPADADGDGFNELVDCDDTNADINPDAEEMCDDVDNDCDALIDEIGAADAITWYVDGDGDGYGDAGVTRLACSQPDFYVDNADDCNDSQSTAYPGGDELCDGLDNDCDGEVDEEALDAVTYFWDFDADGFGDPDRPVRACEPAEWLVEDNNDCNDAVAAVNPVAQEVCDDIDNDCDGAIDDEDSSVNPDTFSMWWPDTDGDGYGVEDEENLKMACEGGEGYADNTDDCNDEDASVTTDCTEPI